MGAKDSVFLSTHEPCCMCISAICWSGFPKVYYLFPYETTRDQGIPHDLKIMHELWGVERYKPQNQFMTSVAIGDLIAELPEEERSRFSGRLARISEQYETLSRQYHTDKVANASNTLAFDSLHPGST